MIAQNNPKEISLKTPFKSSNPQYISKNQEIITSEQQESDHETMHVFISQSISSYNPKSGITPCINEDTLYEHEEE